MKTDVRVVCRPEVAAGFRLTGLVVTPAATAADAERIFREMLDDPDVGVVLMEEAQFERLPDELRRVVGRRALPMVVPFPGPAWEARPELPESYIVELLRQVIGYRVRLR